MHPLCRPALIVAIAAGPILAADRLPDDYPAQIESWRTAREARLRSDDGWLTVAGLFWLHDGENRFGSDPSGEIALPQGSSPARAGRFDLKEGRVTVSIEPGVTATSGGAPVTTMPMRPDTAGDPDLLTVGDLTLFVIERGGRPAIRLRDKNSAMRRDFKGLSWFPVDPAYRVVATFVKYDPPRMIPIPNILGQTEPLPCPGALTFSLKGRPFRLEPVLEEPGATELFVIFRDQTSGRGTYPSGRFVYTDLPKDGKVVLDFNKAYNPPCAFTPYATCPLPPKQNVLAIPIDAGERDDGHHAAQK